MKLFSQRNLLLIILIQTPKISVVINSTKRLVKSFFQSKMHSKYVSSAHSNDSFFMLYTLVDGDERPIWIRIVPFSFVRMSPKGQPYNDMNRMIDFHSSCTKNCYYYMRLKNTISITFL